MTQKPRVWDWKMIMENGYFLPTDHVLETGALFGEFSLQLAPKVKSIIVTDSYDWAERRFVREDGRDLVKEWEEHLSGIKNIKVEKADMQMLPFEADKFDKVICISAIEHVIDDRMALYEMMRVLKPGGLLLLTTEYNPTNSHTVMDVDGSFYRVYDNEDLDKLFRGFKVILREAFTETPTDYTTIFIVVKK